MVFDKKNLLLPWRKNLHGPLEVPFLQLFSLTPDDELFNGEAELISRVIRVGQNPGNSPLLVNQLSSKRDPAVGPDRLNVISQCLSSLPDLQKQLLNLKIGRAHV